MDKILTIVIPAYNVEKELAKCIESCMNQDLPKDSYEIIIVNDGSTDQTLYIANYTAAKYNTIRVISQPNMGLSGARNTGMKYAKGKYIWFIDSDDFIKENVLKLLLSKVEKENLDCLFFRLKRVFEKEQMCQEVGVYECVQPQVEKNKIMTGKQAIIQGYNPSSVCAIIFNTSFLFNNNLQFLQGIYHEDAEFTYRMMCKAERVKFITISPYCYFTHSGTMTRSKSIKSILKNRIDDITVAVSYLKLASETISEPELSFIIERRAKSILFGLLWEAWLNRKEWNKNGINETIIKTMKNKHLYPLKSPYGSFKQAIISFALLNKKIFFKI